MIPRKIGLAMRDIYWNQQRFERREGKYPRYFVRRPGFSDAFAYLRFRSEATGEKKEIRAWWKEFIRTNPIPLVQEKQGRGRGKQERRRPGRRRRGRSEKNRQEAQKPKS